MDDASRWACLYPDLVRLIGWRVLAGDLLDYVRFRAVCPLWRSSTVCPLGRGLVDERFHPRLWVLLPEGRALFPGHSELHGYVRFFNLSTGLSVRARLPLFEDHRILDSVDGLVLLLQERDGAIRLLHPFTGDIAELPPLSTLVSDFAAKSKLSSIWDLSDFRKISATSVSVSSDGLITVMILLSMMGHVAFATTSGGIDRQWSVSSWSLSPMWRSVSFQGRLYILQRSGYNSSNPQILQIDPPHHDKEILSPPKLIATCPGKIQPPYHLVQCDSDVLAIGCSDKPNSLHLLVYRLADLILNKFTPVESIGGNVLFANIERSLSVSARALPTIVGDTIVKLKPRDIHLGEYHLKGGTWLRTTDESTCGLEPSPGNLIHRIFWCHHNR
ncbi:uncharacterized protein LOC124662888 [Lolium rigidum]|uniref:uncharacterized protein LOC124662888 n=1 Tax=Lolium rigidum TaxID=89674 RepID=UPI001F5D9C5E|nr:uncharacterized protein LOC124662888 [Lolium rigidum]